MNPEWMVGELAWYPEAEGGRAAPPPGPTYATTARLADDPLEDAFSVYFRFRPQTGSNGTGGPPHQPVEFALLFPENFPDQLRRMTPGARLIVHEGRQAVAECRVLSPALTVPGTRV